MNCGKSFAGELACGKPRMLPKFAVDKPLPFNRWHPGRRAGLVAIPVRCREGT